MTDKAKPRPRPSDEAFERCVSGRGPLRLQKLAAEARRARESEARLVTVVQRAIASHSDECTEPPGRCAFISSAHVALKLSGVDP